jgi:hypothetical protein
LPYLLLLALALRQHAMERSAQVIERYLDTGQPRCDAGAMFG